MNSMTSLDLVSTSNGLRYEGSVLNLENFQGDILIQDSSFSDNKFNYDGCENILSSLSVNPVASSSVDNFNQLYNP